MRSLRLALTLLCALAASAAAQQSSGGASPPATARADSTAAPAKPTLAQLGLIVYPAKHQSKEQQAKDEAACYQWAESQTGIQLTATTPNTDEAGKAAAAKADSATQGAAVRGAARGALGGVAIGAIAGDAGTGAAIGAVAGAMGGRRARRSAVAQAEKAGKSEAEKKQKELIEQFKKAVCACLEGRGYTCK